MTFEKRFTLKNYLKIEKTRDMLWLAISGSAKIRVYAVHGINALMPSPFLCRAISFYSIFIGLPA
jgi:hypothetical protein